MSNFTSVNILDMINAIGEEELQLILSDFSCPKNHEIEEIQWQIGGGVVYLECEDKPKLLSFYQNKENRYQIFGDRYSARDSVKYAKTGTCYGSIWKIEKRRLFRL